MNSLDKRAERAIFRERSNFQLKHFVVGQHDTPEMRYRQILIEAKDLLYKIKHAELSMEITREKIKKLETKSDKISQLKAKKLKLGLAVSLDALDGAKQELDYLGQLSKDYRHYSNDEIESNQEQYWTERLTRQALTDRMANEQGIDRGNVASLINIGLLQKQLTP